MPTRLEEIQKEIGEHSRVVAERQSLIRTLMAEADSIIATSVVAISPTGTDLFFSVDNRSITWNGGSIRLGRKSLLFIKTLWEGKGHASSIERLEHAVWKRGKKPRLVKVGNRTIKSDFVPKNTFYSFLCRLKNELSGKFPYKITQVRSRETQEIVGYGLKRTALRKNKIKNAQ